MDIDGNGSPAVDSSKTLLPRINCINHLLVGIRRLEWAETEWKSYFRTLYWGSETQDCPLHMVLIFWDIAKSLHISNNNNNSKNDKQKHTMFDQIALSHSSTIS